MEKITFIKETVDVISNDTNGKSCIPDSHRYPLHIYLIIEATMKKISPFFNLKKR